MPNGDYMASWRPPHPPVEAPSEIDRFSRGSKEAIKAIADEAAKMRYRQQQLIYGRKPTGTGCLSGDGSGT